MRSSELLVVQGNHTRPVATGQRVFSFEMEQISALHNKMISISADLDLIVREIVLFDVGLRHCTGKMTGLLGSVSVRRKNFWFFFYALVWFGLGVGL
jgi:hypothetical protein